MKKRVLSLLIVLLLCLQMLPLGVFAANDSGSPKHIPRVVSIVFDDSGSMYDGTDRWAYTSYAMQAFAAMMGSEDVLYITYLNAPAGTVKVDLSDGAKHSTVNSFYSIMFGGSTPDKLKNGAQCLEQEYAKYKTDAKYYLVVMADGQLDSGLGVLADNIGTVAAQTEARLSGADFETIYFSMNENDSTTINGVACHFASSSGQIANALKDVSADIMGRTEVKNTVSGGKLSFTLQYPALSIAVFAQKENGNFDSFKASIQKDGKNLSCQVGNYSVKCPTQIVKNLDTSVYKEKIPQNPPSGVVSLITNGGNPLAKGSYTVDVSGYDLQTGDVVVLVEPAVRIGCKYILNNDDNAISFEELKKRVSEGDTVRVECGLYELNSDGSLGDPVPLDVLSPSYKILVNGKQIGEKVTGTDNTYKFQVTKEFEDKELKVEASLKGYQPFVMKETFGKLNLSIQAKPLPETEAEIRLTKPLWQKWSAGQEGIRFELEKADATILNRTAIKIDGCEGLPVGVCSGIKDAVRLEGNTVVYLPKAQLPFAQLPQSFTVSLQDIDTLQTVVTKTVRVIQPAYRLEASNELNGPLSLEQLKNNSSGMRFTLTVDYDGSGQYTPVSQSNCEDPVEITVSSGVLPGEVIQETGAVRFVPKYDPANTQLSAGELIGKTHSVSASATVAGQEIKSEELTVSLSSAAYRIEVDNPITQPFSLDTVKTNQSKIVFRLLADYDGSGNYSQLASWDQGAAEKIQITSGDLPGRIETAYDHGGQTIGKAFIPLYDENNNNGIPFTKVAGKVHQITGSVQDTDMSVSTTVEVLAPDYEIVVRKDGIILTDVTLWKNTEGVEFAVSRDGRALTAKELEGLAPYELSLDKKQSWIKISTKVQEAPDGTACLLCVPEYGGWRFPAVWFWNWLTLFTVKKGDMTMTLTLGEDIAVAALKIETSEIAWLIFFIVLVILLFILWICFCCATRIRFLRGVFYKVSFRKNPNGMGYIVSNRTPQNANKNGVWKFLFSGKCLIPFSEQSTSLVLERKSAVLVAQKSPFETFNCRSYPYSVADRNKTEFHKGRLSKAAIRAIVNRDNTFVLEDGVLDGTPFGDNDKKMDMGVFLVEKNSKRILFFLTKSEEREIKQRRRSARQAAQRAPRKRR